MAEPVAGPLIYTHGVAGAALFYGRFYVQWLVSERHRRSVMPVAFWYMSSTGSVVLFVFAILTRSPVGALSHNFNLLIYSRNLIHIWRAKGTLSDRRNLLVHAAVALFVLVAIGFVIRVWYREYEDTQKMTAAAAQTTWLWLAVGLAGQALFAARFIIQWIATERRRVSFIPTVFWQISIVAAALQAASFVQRAEWVFAAGSMSTILIYARNLWFIRLHPGHPETATLNG
jgi:lipid-A-disaccharide synthase-like uncharacterized protein